MKISEVVEKLLSIQKEFGDIDVVNRHDLDDVESVTYHSYKEYVDKNTDKIVMWVEID